MKNCRILLRSVDRATESTEHRQEDSVTRSLPPNSQDLDMDTHLVCSLDKEAAISDSDVIEHIDGMEKLVDGSSKKRKRYLDNFVETKRANFTPAPSSYDDVRKCTELDIAAEANQIRLSEIIESSAENQLELRFADVTCEEASVSMQIGKH